MAAWLIPALKAVLPHVATVISAAGPVFTRKKAEAAANQVALLQQQVTELQAAASENAAHIKALAAQLQTTIQALEHAGTNGETKLNRAIRFCAVALGCSVIALCIAVYVIWWPAR